MAKNRMHLLDRPSRAAVCSSPRGADARGTTVPFGVVHRFGMDVTSSLQFRAAADLTGVAQDALWPVDPESFVFCVL